MELGQPAEIVVRLGGPGPVGRWTVLWLVLTASLALSCSFALFWVHSHNFLFLSLAFMAGADSWRRYEASSRETLTFSQRRMTLVFQGALRVEERVFELAQVSTLEIVRRRTRRAADGGRLNRYFQFWYQGRPERARRTLSAQEASQLERVLGELEERDADGPSREDPLVFRGGVKPQVLRRLRR